MGVDARMLVRIPRPVSDAELREWRYRFGSMAHHWLFLGYDERVYHKPLERIDVFEQDGDDIVPNPGETFLYVPLSGRYYGEGYERGDLLAYVGIADFLETLIPGSAIWYGGDSSGICAEPFTAVERQRLLRHAANVSHDPYEVGFSSLRRDEFATGVSCPNCEYAMPRCGFGARYALYRCSGCGWEIQHKDGKVRNGFGVSSKPEKVPA